jgi:uncharacterized protein YjbJ (UPF0337 family)
MNQDIFKGNWKQLKGKIQEQWGKLTDDDLDVAEGKRDQFLGRLQEKYGMAKEEAERQLKDFEDRIRQFAAQSDLNPSPNPKP